MANDSMAKDIKDRIDSTEREALRCMDINRKANTAISDQDFGMFTKSELVEIAQLSANRATVLRRELREYRAELVHITRYIDELIEARKAEN